jgi:hypothetical protein
MKNPFAKNIKHFRDRVEFKIKKIKDLIEQLKEERQIKLSYKTELSKLHNKVSSLFNSQNANHLSVSEDNQNILKSFYDRT